MDSIAKILDKEIASKNDPINIIEDEATDIEMDKNQASRSLPPTRSNMTRYNLRNLNNWYGRSVPENNQPTGMGLITAVESGYKDPVTFQEAYHHPNPSV